MLLENSIDTIHMPCNSLVDSVGKAQVDFQNIPISFYIMKESLWLLSLYTNLSLHKAIKMLHWLEPLHKSGDCLSSHLRLERFGPE